MSSNPVGIFWDIENCSVPKNKSPSGIIAHIRTAFVLNRLNNREYEFLIACDVTRIRSDIREDINKAGGVTLAHVNGDSKNAADEKLKESMKRFVDTHSSFGGNLTLVLISSDIDFVNDVRGFQTRWGCAIILVHAATCSPQFKIGWNEVWAFRDICAVVPENSRRAIDQTKIYAHANVQSPDFQPTHRHPPRDDDVTSNHSDGGGQGSSNTSNRGRGQYYLNAHNQAGRDEHNMRSAPHLHDRQYPHYGGDAGKVQGQNEYRGYGGPPGRGRGREYPTNRENSDNGPARPDDSNLHEGFNLAPYPQQRQQFQRRGQSGQSRGNMGRGRGTLPSAFSRSNPNLNMMDNEAAGEGHSESTTTSYTTFTEQRPRPEFILMVAGLPGKVDFRILRERIQEQAYTVYGRVKYVNNGQAFISFHRKENADRGAELFHGKEVFGNKLTVQFVQKIPFDNSNPVGGSWRKGGGGPVQWQGEAPWRQPKKVEVAGGGGEKEEDDCKVQ